jgi:hypothetical protein
VIALLCSFGLFIALPRYYPDGIYVQHLKIVISPYVAAGCFSLVIVRAALGMAPNIDAGL